MGDANIPPLEMLRGIHAHFRANWPAIERENPPGTPQYALNRKLMENLEDIIRFQDTIEALERNGQQSSQHHVADLQRRLIDVSHNLQNMVAFVSEIEGERFIKPAGLELLP